jgi:uncharacterized protein YndB with AHSA1/START domain
MNMSESHENKTAAPVDLVKKQVFVKTTPQRAFDVFTKEMGTWWPLVSHHIGKADAKDAVIEPFVGGRWFERGADDSECDWGRVLAWDPPARLLLAWQLSAEWKHDATLMTEVEVRFTSENGGTRVELEHRLLRNFGARSEEMRTIFDSPGGWGGMIAAYAARVDAA